MVRLKYILIPLMVLSLGIAGIWGIGILFPGEEKKVKKQFDQLSESVSKDSNENILLTAQKVKRIGHLFTQPCEFKADVISYSGNYSPEEITSYAAQARSRFLKLTLKFYDLTIDSLEKGEAKVNVTGRLTGTLTSGESVEETRELICILKKIEKEWHFSGFEVIDVLKK